jgi:hypothetical protein
VSVEESVCDVQMRAGESLMILDLWLLFGSKSKIMTEEI